MGKDKKKKGTTKAQANQASRSASSAVVGDKLPTEFRRCGDGGSSASTTTNNKAAKDFLNQFFVLKLVDLQLGEFNDEDAIPAAKPYEDTICQLPLLQEFGAFLCEEAKTKRMHRMEENQAEILHTQRALLSLLQRGTSVMPTGSSAMPCELLAMPVSSTTCATFATAAPMPADVPPITCCTIPSSAPAVKVGAARPVSFLPPLPTLYSYEVGLGSVDICDLFHRAFKVGTVVTHTKKQERGRLRAVVSYAQKLLSSTDTNIQSIAARLNAAPVPPSSAMWPEWARTHREACAELKSVVKTIVSADGPELLSTSVSNVGSRILLGNLLESGAA